MSDHEWCRDTARDEAIRAAEDAAAVPAIQHRDLPEVVADLRERVARLEAVIPKSVSVSNAEAHENKGVTMPADGLRTEGWLTAEEREAVDAARDYFDDDNHGDSECVFIARMLKQLLARETPPRVKLPHLDDLEADERPVWESACSEWIAAIRAAGAEVEG